jgi:hypothetical protein
MFQDLIGQGERVRPLTSDKLPDDISEIIFLHAQEDFIEKTLGEGETMIVHKESLAAFSD